MLQLILLRSINSESRTTPRGLARHDGSSRACRVCIPSSGLDGAEKRRSRGFASAKSRLEVIEDPLYLALEDMWLQLGVQQGMVKAETTQEDHAIGERGQENRGRQAADRPNAARNRHLAATR
jgi:hypothetical protein